MDTATNPNRDRLLAAQDRATERFFPELAEAIAIFRQTGELPDFEWESVSCGPFTTQVQECVEAIADFVGVNLVATAPLNDGTLRIMGADRSGYLALEWLGTPEGVQQASLAMGTPAADDVIYAQRNIAVALHWLRHYEPKVPDGWLARSVSDLAAQTVPSRRFNRAIIDYKRPCLWLVWKQPLQAAA